MNRRNQLIHCATVNCPNVQLLHTDSDLPKHWLCSCCEDALTAQMLDDLNRRELTRSKPELVNS